MDVFCPHCLQNVTLKGREPGVYAFNCPECEEEVQVTISQNSGERPVVRPVRRQPTTGGSPPSNSRAGGGGKVARSSGAASDRDAPAKRPSRTSARGGDRESIDFPFEASDDNLVDAQEEPVQDEWDGPQFEIPQPLRGVSKKKRKPESKPKPRNSEPEPDFNTYLKWMVVAAAVWVALTVAGIYYHEVGWPLVVLGVLAVFTSRSIILRKARKEGAAVWLACLVVPFYSIFFVLSHFRQTARALVIAFFGYAYLISGFGVLIVHDFVDKVQAIQAGADPDDDEGDEELQKAAAAKMLGAADSITVSVNGKETKIPVKELVWFEAQPGKHGAAESFEISGPDVSLRGNLPAGFHGDWMSLLGKPIRLSPRSDRPEPGESHVKLPGRGVVPVTGGQFVFSAVLKDPAPQLFGAIELDIAGAPKPETLHGMFNVRVKAGN
jgi:hypothetical protein